LLKSGDFNVPEFEKGSVESTHKVLVPTSHYHTKQDRRAPGI
jgi:hypothetical protein